MSKGSLRRPEAEKKKRRIALGWELRDPRTTAERKKEILRMIEEIQNET